ncbi:MAG: glycosyltransferase [Chloroflexota bacterium]
MTQQSVLFISPDYVSHYYPMSAVAQACARRGIRVTFATGPGLEGLVRENGFGYAKLVLGPGKNDGLLRPEEQPGSEADHMRAFFEATREGPAATLIHQSGARMYDMLHNPIGVFERLGDILADVRPDAIVVDQLSYSATLALHALSVPFVSFVPSNPANLPTRHELFGMPRRMPPPLTFSEHETAMLHRICLEVTRRFTATFNTTLVRIAPHVSPVRDAFAFTSPWRVLFNYPQVLAEQHADLLPLQARLLGSSLRAEVEDPEFSGDLNHLSRSLPTVYVSFGTFLSARQDVLDKVVQALKVLPVNVILASGVADTVAWRPIPSNWIVRSVLPQLAALRHADLAISHGGNNTVTEALTLGVPLLIGPFSSDQFDNAADVTHAGLGSVFDPNRATPDDLRAAIEHLLVQPRLRTRVATCASTLQSRPGPSYAAELLEEHIGEVATSVPALAQ